jgi:hypothetical protein
MLWKIYGSLLEACGTTIIFIEFMVQFWDGFLYSPNYLNKLIKGIKEII